MPRTVEHLVETHRLARDRLAAGLPIWQHEIKLGDIWRAEHLSFEQRPDQVVARLRESAWLAGRGELDPLVEVIDNLAHAEHGDEFDEWWDQVYDAADLERVWIGTWC